MSCSRASWMVSLLFACLAAGAGAWGYVEYKHAADSGNSAADLDFTKRRLALLQDENTKLHALVADQEKSIASAYEASQRKSIEQAVVAIRGLDFKRPVVYDSVSRAGIKKTLEQKLSEQYSDHDFENFATALEAFGLLPPGYQLKEKYIALLGEQVAAFYDQHQHKLFMFEDASLRNTQNRIVLAHELTHALQDQNFGLLRMPLEIKNNDDLSLATSALIEGDATVVMTDYMMQNFTLKTLRENLSGMVSTNTQQLAGAPRYMREMLMFPYLRGQEFCNALQAKGGYDAISDAYKNPPSSSTQILHPEKYFAHEEPIRIDWPDTTGPGGKPIDDNVLGEFGTRILLSQWIDDKTGAAASEGWRGDRYLVFDGGKGLVWKTVWADDAHAQKFRDALMRYVEKRFPQTAMEGDTLDPSHMHFSSPSCTGEIITAKTGNGIILIWGATKELNDALVEKFKEE